MYTRISSQPHSPQKRNPAHTTPHLNILRIQHQRLHPLIQPRKRLDELLRGRGYIPAILAELVELGRIEAVAADDVAAAAGRHDDLVDAEAAPVLDGLVVDVVVEAEGAQLGGADDAPVAARRRHADVGGYSEECAAEGLEVSVRRRWLNV